MSLALVGLRDGRLAASFDDFTIKITNSSNFTNYTTLTGHTENIKALVELDDHVLASGSCDNTIRLWNLTTMSALATIDAQQGCINSLININFNQKNYLVSGGEVNGTKIWNNTNSNLFTIASDGPVKALAYSENYLFLAVGSASNLKIWEIIKSKNIIQCGSYSLDKLAVLPQYIVGACGSDILIWDSASFEYVTKLSPSHWNRVSALITPESTQYIISVSFETTIQIWNSTTFQLFKTLNNHTDIVLSLAFMPSTQYLVSGSISELKIWSLFSFECINSLQQSGSSLTVLSLSNMIVAIGNDSQIYNSSLSLVNTFGLTYSKFFF